MVKYTHSMAVYIIRFKMFFNNYNYMGWNLSIGSVAATTNRNKTIYMFIAGST